MKQKLRLMIPAVLILLLLGWYLWPRSLSSVLSGLQPEEITACYAMLLTTDPAVAPPIQKIDIPVDSAGFGQLLTLLQSARYTHSPSDILRLGRASRTQSITLFPSHGEILLYQGNVIYQIDVLGPHITVQQSGTGRKTYLPQGGKGFQREIISLLDSLTTP